MKLTRILAGVVLCSPISAAMLRAQTQTTGAITGQVTDPTGAVLPGATVDLLSRATGNKSTAAADNQGNFRFGLLAPGIYDLHFSAPNFASSTPPPVNVVVTQTVAVNMALSAGSQAQTIEVTSTVAQLQTQNAAEGTTVEGATIQALPLAGRNYTQVLTMSPGVAGGVNNAAELGRGTIDVYVNGASNISNNFVMDGADINNFGSGRGGDFVQQGGIPIPNPDAIEEFRIQTTLFDAGYGRDAGANVEVVTRAGTNHLHGSVWEFLRNDKLNSNDPFLKAQGTGRPDMKQNQFGGALGGPILRDRFFFFGSYQGTRQVNGLSSSSFSTNILPPLTSDRTPAGIGAASCGGPPPALGGVTVRCDGSNINPVSLKLLQMKNPDGTYLVPTPITTYTSGTYLQGRSSYTIPGRFTEDQAVANLDYQISPKNQLSERFFYSRDPQLNPFSSCNPGCPPGFALKTQFTNDVGSLRLSSALHPSLLNEALVAFIRNTGNLQSQTAITDSSLGITPGDPGFPLLPVTVVNGLFSLGGGFNDFSNSAVNTIQAADQISWTHGKNTLRAGFEFENQQFNFRDPGPRRGEILFLTFQDFLLGESGAQNGSGSSNVFLSYGIAGNISKDFRAKDMSSFAQDDYKVSSHLTLNAGIRWEINGNIGEKYGALSNIFPSIMAASPAPTAAGTYAGFVVPANFPGTVPSGIARLSGNSLAQTTYPLHNFGPRVGFAWQPYADGRTSLRGGYGIYYTRPNGNATLQTLTSAPFVAIRALSGQSNTAATFQVPYNPAPVPGSFPLRTPTSELAADIVAENYDSPFTEQYDLNVQQQISPSTVVELAYVGNRSTRLLESRNINEPLLASPGNPINGVTTNTQSNAYLRVPYLGFSTTGLTRIESYGFSMYNSLQATVRRQLSHGVELQAAYTWGKILTDVQGSGYEAVFTGGSGDSNDPDNRQQRWGPAAFNRTHRFVFVYRWELPRLQNGAFLTRAALNGWVVSGVTTIQSGDRLTITDSLGGSIYGFASTSRAQLAPGFLVHNLSTPGAPGHRLNNFLNAGALCGKAGNTGCGLPLIGDGTGYGNLRTGSVSGPSQDNSDFALSRTFHTGLLSETARLDFRSEFFNGFNHPQYSDPSTAFNSAGFGAIGSTSVAPRIIQFALKYTF